MCQAFYQALPNLNLLQPDEFDDLYFTDKKTELRGVRNRIRVTPRSHYFKQVCFFLHFKA